MTQKLKKATDILLEIDIATECQDWNECGFNIKSLIDSAARTAIKSSDISPEINDKTGEISIVLCDDNFIRKLNKEYRNKDKPTNVLSFPQIDFQEDLPPDITLAIGDIILAHNTIMREAKEQNKSFKDHFTHLIVHGTLHLLGYDHEVPLDAKEMEALEIIILKQINVKNPYSDTNFMA